MSSLSERFGICQWFHYRDYRSVERCAALMRELDVRHLRTGISWADYHRPGGAEWYESMLELLAPFEILLSVWHTPPSLSETGHCAAPPRRLRDYADFIDTVIRRHRDRFTHLELWNEPNNRYKWQFETLDPDWSKFAEMVGSAAYWAKQCGVPTVLGGMMPVDEHWLQLMADKGVLDHIDTIAIHGFPGMWWSDRPNWDWHSHWQGWDEKIARVTRVGGGRTVWITEAGFSTWASDAPPAEMRSRQSHYLEAATIAASPRVYWYSMIDLDPRREAIEGFHVDENEYHLGLVTAAGRRKPAFERLKTLLRADKAVSASR